MFEELTCYIVPEIFFVGLEVQCKVLNAARLSLKHARLTDTNRNSMYMSNFIICTRRKM